MNRAAQYAAAQHTHPPEKNWNILHGGNSHSRLWRDTPPSTLPSAPPIGVYLTLTRRLCRPVLIVSLSFRLGQCLHNWLQGCGCHTSSQLATNTRCKHVCMRAELVTMVDAAALPRPCRQLRIQLYGWCGVPACPDSFATHHSAGRTLQATIVPKSEMMLCCVTAIEKRTLGG